MTEVWTEGGTRCFCGRPIPAAALDAAEARGRAEEREAVLATLAKRGYGATELYDEIRHGAHRWPVQT